MICIRDKDVSTVRNLTMCWDFLYKGIFIRLHYFHLGKATRPQIFLLYFGKKLHFHYIFKKVHFHKTGLTKELHFHYIFTRRGSQRNYTRTEEYLAEMVLTYWSNFITSGFVVITTIIIIVIITIISMMVITITLISIPKIIIKN